MKKVKVRLVSEEIGDDSGEWQPKFIYFLHDENGVLSHRPDEGGWDLPACNSEQEANKSAKEAAIKFLEEKFPNYKIIFE